MLAQSPRTFFALHCFNIHTNRVVFLLKINYYHTVLLYIVFLKTSFYRKNIHVCPEHRVWASNAGVSRVCKPFFQKIVENLLCTWGDAYVKGDFIEIPIRFTHSRNETDTCGWDNDGQEPNEHNGVLLCTRQVKICLLYKFARYWFLSVVCFRS